MEALRILQKPENGTLTINLPRHLAQEHELEIIILPSEQDSSPVTEKTFNPMDYFGLWKHKNIDPDQVSQELRGEWERQF